MPREKKQHLKRRKDGRYCAVYKGIQFMAHSEEDALEMRRRFRESQGTRNGNNTVFEYAYNWLPIHKASVSANTYNAYALYLNKLVSKIGRMIIRDVTPSDIKDVYNLFIGKSESTIRKARMLYVDLWDCAIEDGFAESNPCRSKAARPHHGSSGSHRALSQEEDELILIHENKLRKAVLLMRYAGLRRGEVLAFDIDKNVDFERNIIIIESAIRFEGNKGITVEPKTSAGKREIPLLDILRSELKDQHGKIIQGKVTSSMWRSLWTQYIHSLETRINNCPQKRWFHRTADWIMEHQDEWREYLAIRKKSPSAAEEFRLREWKSVSIRPHDLRHSYCTMLRDAGVDLKLAVKWMGHSDEKMVLRIYDHPSEKRIQNAIENLNQSTFHMQNNMQTKPTNQEHNDNPSS